MTMLIVPSRRKFLTCLVGLVAAPAVVKAESLMRVRGFVLAPMTASEVAAREAAQVQAWMDAVNKMLEPHIEQMCRALHESLLYGNGAEGGVVMSIVNDEFKFKPARLVLQ